MKTTRLIRITLAMALCAAALVTSARAAAQAQTAPAAGKAGEKTLFVRLGGIEAIRSVVNDFVGGGHHGIVGHHTGVKIRIPLEDTRVNDPVLRRHKTSLAGIITHMICHASTLVNRIIAASKHRFPKGNQRSDGTRVRFSGIDDRHVG